MNKHVGLVICVLAALAGCILQASPGGPSARPAVKPGDVVDISAVMACYLEVEYSFAGGWLDGVTVVERLPIEHPLPISEAKALVRAEIYDYSAGEPTETDDGKLHVKMARTTTGSSQ